MIAPDLAAAKTFLQSQGVELESDEEPVMIEPGEPPTVVIRQTLRTPLPDYRGEPYVNVEAVRGEWALLSSYSADRTWRVRLRTGEVTSIEKAIPANLRQFGFQQDGRNRLYFAFDDEGGFLASLRDDFGGGSYRSADVAHQWTRIGSAAREIDSIYGHGEHGTYVISAFATGPTTTWVEPPEDHEPMISGAFARLDRPSIGKSYDVPTNGTALSANGLCAAFLERAEDCPTLTMLNLETGPRPSPEPRVKAGENLRWVALSP